MIENYRIYYYIDSRGHSLVEDWIKDRDNANIRDNIDARISWLAMHGLELLQNPKLLDAIEPRSEKDRRITGFYELKSIAKKWRIAVYHELRDQSFILLWGFRKSQRKQPEEIENSYAVFEEYQRRKVLENVKVIYQRTR